MVRLRPELSMALSEDVLPPTAEEARSMLQGVGSRFDYHVCKTLCDLRTQEIFDIIIDYPDSQPALQDLKEIGRAHV